VRPNPRVQRTRAYASLRRSPLTRHPLGGSKACVFALTLLVTHASCIGSTDLTPLAPASRGSTTCEVNEELAGRTFLSVEVVDGSNHLVPPSMSIKMRRLDDSDSPLIDQHVDKNPAEFDALPVGRWNIEISIPTSPHVVHCTVDLKENWSCRVRVVFLERRT
jgi:hypothetical protein